MSDNKSFWQKKQKDAEFSSVIVRTFVDQADPQDLYEAIVSNSTALVKAFLKVGLDGFASDHYPVPMRNLDIKLASPDSFGRYQNSCNDFDDISIVGNSENSVATPLYIACVNCYVRSLKLDGAEFDSSLEILNALLGCGVDPSARVRDIVLKFGNDVYVEMPTRALSVIGLLLFLKEKVAAPEKRCYIDRIVEKILNIPDTAKSVNARKNMPTKAIPTSVVATWKNLLFSEDFSDVHFECDDGTVLHAHRNVLSAASSYFSGICNDTSWEDSYPDGSWPTSKPSQTMKAILTYIYTGEINTSMVDENPRAFLSIAHEYDLPSLQELGEASCKGNITSDNIKETLQIAKLYNCEGLKLACFKYIYRHAAKVLSNPEMASLASEDKDLWNELRIAVAHEEKKLHG